MSLQRNYADFFTRNYLNLSPQILEHLKPVVMPIVNHCGDAVIISLLTHEKKLIPLKIFLSRGLVLRLPKNQSITYRHSITRSRGIPTGT